MKGMVTKGLLLPYTVEKKYDKDVHAIGWSEGYHIKATRVGVELSN